MLKLLIPPEPQAKKIFPIIINTIYKYKIDPKTPQQASKMQFPLCIAEFTRQVNSANSVCDVFSFVACLLISVKLWHDFPLYGMNYSTLVQMTDGVWTPPKLFCRLRLGCVVIMNKKVKCVVYPRINCCGS